MLLRKLIELEKKYIAVESFKNNQQLFNLQCWALTCQSFLARKSGNGYIKN